jgi:hypothetical protein
MKVGYRKLAHRWWFLLPWRGTVLIYGPFRWKWLARFLVWVNVTGRLHKQAVRLRLL